MKALLKSIVAGLMLMTSSAFADLIVVEKSTKDQQGSIYVAVWLPVNSGFVGPISNNLLAKQAATIARAKGCGGSYALLGSTLVVQQMITGRTDLSSTGFLKYFGFNIRCDYGNDLIQSNNFDASK